MPSAASSAIPAVLLKLGPLDADRVADVRPYLDAHQADPVELATVIRGH
ncbi:hypothetical protein [Streptomyces kanamyceticus]|nr:hypothetical protein [Streptomyces kanamyceticus]